MHHDHGARLAPRGAPPDATGTVLVLLAHPALQRSRVNRSLVDAILGLPGVTVHDLYDAYPDFDIDVAREQALLVHHQILVWQHPLYWYSTPALLKEWQDLVLEFNWAYGPKGDALRGKLFLSALSTGGAETAYHPAGSNRYTIQQLLAPIDQTAHLCGMHALPPFVVHGAHRLDEAGIAAQAADYRRTIEALRDGRIDPGALAGLSTLNGVIAAREA